MSDHVAIYLDESGDLGFDENKPGASDHFTITLLVCEGRETDRKIKQAVARTLKNKLNRKRGKNTVAELKGSTTKLSTKRYFFTQLPVESWQIYAISVHKRDVHDHLTTLPGRQKLYNYLAKELMRTIRFPRLVRTVNLVVDKCKNAEEIKDFNQYLYWKLGILLPLEVLISIKHEKSHLNRGLQAVDLFSWGIFRELNKDSSDWYQVFKQKIKNEMIYFK